MCYSEPAVRNVFAGFRPPWYLLESAGEYGWLFEDAGFRVLFSSLEDSMSRRTPSEVFDIFCSGAKAGYLDPACYVAPWREGYGEALLDGVRLAFESMADEDGRLELVFRRIFIVAGRQE